MLVLMLYLKQLAEKGAVELATAMQVEAGCAAAKRTDQGTPNAISFAWS